MARVEVSLILKVQSSKLFGPVSSLVLGIGFAKLVIVSSKEQVMTGHRIKIEVGLLAENELTGFARKRECGRIVHPDVFVINYLCVVD